MSFYSVVVVVVSLLVLSMLDVREVVENSMLMLTD